MSAAEELPDVMPVAWDNIPIDAIQVSVSTIDEYGLPQERRGVKTKVPTDPIADEAFAEQVAETVRKTIVHILKSRRGNA